MFVDNYGEIDFDQDITFYNFNRAFNVEFDYVMYAVFKVEDYIAI